MSINSIFQFLVPKDKKFFPLFEQASSNLVLLAETLHEAVFDWMLDRDIIVTLDDDGWLDDESGDN